MKFRFLVSIIVLISMISIVKAQSAGIHLMLGYPQGEFKENVDRLGYGFNIYGTLWSPSKERPFTIGLNVGYLVYGEESERRRFSNPIPDVWVDVNRTNSILNFHLLFQISPFTGTWRPYVEGLFGGAYIFTSTNIESEWDNEEIARSTNFDDYTWSYGGGAGLLIKLSENLGDVSTLYLDLKARYMFGTNAEYLAEGSITVDQKNGNVYYDVLESKTDLLSVHIGVTAYF
ncbi:MAG: hypothetical protein M5R37_08905 [Melioribacteraceae bacterium]|nr:hypothetical protein [Melioribacteraceae bacterium]